MSVPLAILVAVVSMAARLGAERVAELAARSRLVTMVGAAVVVALAAIAVDAITGGGLDLVLFSGQSAMPEYLAITSIGTALVVLLGKFVGYTASLGNGFRGGPIFPAVAIGVIMATSATLLVGGTSTSALAAVGIAAATAACMRMPFTALLLGVMLTYPAGGATTVLAIVGTIVGLARAWPGSGSPPPWRPAATDPPRRGPRLGTGRPPLGGATGLIPGIDHRVGSVAFRPDAPRGNLRLLPTSSMMRLLTGNRLRRAVPETTAANTEGDRMSHYKANLRDIEFNLFEVFGAADRLGSGPYAEMDVDTARRCCARSATLCEGPLAESFVDADRNPPVYDPASRCPSTMPESLQEVLRSAHGVRVLAAGPARAPRRLRRPAVAALGRRRDDARRQPGRLHVHVRPRLRRRSSTTSATRSRSAGPRS